MAADPMIRELEKEIAALREQLQAANKERDRWENIAVKSCDHAGDSIALIQRLLDRLFPDLVVADPESKPTDFRDLAHTLWATVMESQPYLKELSKAKAARLVERIENLNKRARKEGLI